MRNWFKALALMAFVFGTLGRTYELEAAMSSTNYYIYSDDFNLGGGLSTGGSYTLNDTIGDSPVGISTSTTYEIRGGYQFAVRGSISIAISSSSLSLGSLATATASSTASTTVTVTTDSNTGYVLSVGSASSMGLASVSDGAVDGDSSSEEYGVGMTGSHRATANDIAVTAGAVLASSASAVPTGSQTVLIFKAVRNSATAAGSYSQSITLSALANF